MFEMLRFASDLWVALVMGGLIWFWLNDFDARRWQEWMLSAIALPPVALTLWRALADGHGLAAVWLWGGGV
jgi:hypothetical protein